MSSVSMQRRSRWFVLMAVVLFATALGACNDGDDYIGGENGAAEDGASETAAFFSDPAQLVGEQITVDAVVDEVVDPNGFRMVAEDPGGEGYLVIHDGTQEFSAGDFVTVVGTVSEFNMAVVENQMGLELDKDKYELYEGEYGIQAESIDTRVE